MFDEVLGDLLSRGCSARFRADGDSMYPTIRAREYVCVDPVGERPLRRGEVVLARAPRGLTAHRIVAIREGQVVLRGDNATAADDPLPLEAIIGRVAAVERNGATVALGRRAASLIALVRLARAARRRLVHHG